VIPVEIVSFIFSYTSLSAQKQSPYTNHKDFKLFVFFGALPIQKQNFFQIAQ
jgi:hypothetical protein